MYNSADTQTSWSSFVKVGQTDLYTRNGGMYGAVSGAALAAIISAIKYGKGKKHHKESAFKRIMNGLLWTGAGALGGGVLGAGIGRMIGNHVEYSRALKKARESVAKRRGASGSQKSGRVLLVNFPKNKTEIGDKAIDNYLPKWVVDRGRDFLKEILPESVMVQHAALITMDNDGGNARIFSVGDMPPDRSRALFKEKMEQGKKDSDNEKSNGGKYGLDNNKTWGDLSVSYVGDSFKGKSNEEIADMLAEYGESGGYGDSAVLYEGRKGVDLDLVHEFIGNAHDLSHGYGGTGYSIAPGGYNCATSMRPAFDVVQSPWSHILDMLYGGRPDANMPILSNATTSKTVPSRTMNPRIKTIWNKQRRKGDEFNDL